MTPLGIDMCKGATYNSKRRGNIGEPCGVPTDTRAAVFGEPWKTRVQVLSHIKEEIQSTI